MKRGIRPSKLRRCNEFVSTHHSYLSGVRGCVFCIEAVCNSRIVAVAIVGRPISQHNDDGVTAEITRLCTSSAAERGTPSNLISRIRRACSALGFKRIITYCDGDSLATAFKSSNFHKRRTVKRTGWHGRQTQQPSNASKFVTLWTLEL